MANAILNFHFDFLTPSLIDTDYNDYKDYRDSDLDLD